MFRGAALGLACGAACWIISLHPVLRRVEEWFQDSNFVNRGVRQSQAHVVVVGLDEDSLAELDEPLTFISPRLAEVVNYSKRKGAAAIGLDVMVPEVLDDFPGLNGKALGEAAALAENVVLPVVATQNRLIRPLRAWRTGSPLALTGLNDDDDLFLRRQQLATRIGNEDYYQFGLELLNVSNQIEPERPNDQLRVNGHIVPMDDENRMRVNYVGPAGTINHVSFRDVLAAERGGSPLTIDFKDAIVIVGVTARYMGDVHATPYTNGAVHGLWSQPNGLMSGPEFHANVVATILDGAFLTTPWWLYPLVPALISGALMGAALTRLNLGHGVGLSFAHHVGWRAFSLGAFIAAHRRVEIVAVILTGAACYTLIFSLRWRQMRRMFGVFKSEAVAIALEDDSGPPQGIGQERVLTVMFADVRGFTGFSDSRRPAEVVALLNAYFNAIVPIIESHGGSVNQYMGDGLMALFGAPGEQPAHALQAVRAAVSMVERVHDLQSEWTALKFPGLGIGVGIHTGTAVVGAVGSRSRLDYSAIGDTVNIAARVEAENKPLGSEILISSATYETLPPGLRLRLGCTTVPEPRRLKGKADSILIHRVIVPGGPPDGLDVRSAEGRESSGWPTIGQ